MTTLTEMVEQIEQNIMPLEQRVIGMLKGMFPSKNSGEVICLFDSFVQDGFKFMQDSAKLAELISGYILDLLKIVE